jgi:hypothetical protein
VFQNWRAWLQEGIIDFALPMAYFDEGSPQQRAWYDSWVNWSRWNEGNRAIVMGMGSWLNNDVQGLHQVYEALQPDEQGRTLDGVAFYSYNQPLAGSSFERRRQYMDQLRTYAFPQPAEPPQWPWVYAMTHGHLQGIAAVNGEVVSDGHVALAKDGQWLRDLPTGYDGWYGAVDLEPGVYQVVIQHPTAGQVTHDVVIQAGMVTNGP